MPCDVDHIIHEACLHARIYLHELIEHCLWHYAIDDGILRIFQNIIHGHLLPLSQESKSAQNHPAL